MPLPEYITNLLEKIALAEGFTNYRFETEAGSKHGENFLGEITAIQLIGDRVKCGEVSIETLNLMCKTAAENRYQRDAFRLIRAFEREVFFYTRVLPLFVDFQKEKGLTADESFLAFPKVLATLFDEENGRYALIMEDLRSKGFDMWPRQSPVTLEHEELIMKQMGRFHAISLALKDQRPEVFAEFEAMDDMFLEIVLNGHGKYMFDHTLGLAIEAAENEGNRQAVKKLQQNFVDTFKSFFTKESIGQWGVINHGDGWINNFLFQYDIKDNVSSNVRESL